MSEYDKEDVNLTQDEKDAILYDCREGDLATLKEIFNEISPSLLMSITDEYTLSTSIHMAAANGHTEVADYLLSLLPEKDAKTLASQKNDSGNTPLHWAALNGHLPVVELLCEKYGADVFARNVTGHDVIFEAENNNQSNIENWLLKKFSVEDQLLVDEKDGETKISYAPGKESKEVDERDRKAKEEIELEAEKIGKKTEKLSI